MIFIATFLFTILQCRRRKKDEKLYGETKSEPKVDLEQDSDDDGAEDYIEDYFGTDKTKSDTDGDGLSDFIELYSLILEPLSTDMDGNGVLDGDEDLDGDGLTNIEESAIGTNIIYVDTDGDGLSDYDENMVHNTNPTKEDTDDDGVSDAKEIEMGTDSSVFEETFYTVVEANEEDSVKVSVETILSGEQVESLTVERYESEFLFPTTMPGYIGGAYDFSVDGELGTATIKFEFDEALLTDATFDPVIYYFDEENQVLEELETTVSGNVASAEVTHFSKYILLDKRYQQNAVRWWPISSVTGYSVTEVVFIISETDSIQLLDSADERYAIVDNTIDQLPHCCALGVMKYFSGLIRWKNLYFEKEYVKECVHGQHLNDAGSVSIAGYCDNDIDYAIMNWAIRTATDLYSYRYDYALKIFVVLGEPRTSDSGVYKEVKNLAKAHNIKVYTVQFGEESDDTNYLEKWSDETGGIHYYASDIADTNILSDAILEEMYKDTDKDGVPDFYEENLRMFNGVTLKLDKYNSDTDGDGLLDGEEVGELQYQYDMDSRSVQVTSKVLSNPLSDDTDIDEISDEEEVIIGTNRFHVDTDNDGMLDGEEYVEGFDPLEADADGDGRYDWLEYAEGTDPYVYNKEWNEYAWEFIRGVVAGDFIADSDSFATTAGQILGSFIPGIDVRDVIGNCVHEDYLMASVSFAGLIPVGGDATKAVGKICKYVAKNADNAPKIAELLAFLNKHFPDIAKALGKSDDFIDVAKRLSKADNLKLTRKQRKVLMETFENAGLSQYLLKTENLDGLKDAVNIGEEVWEEGACKRGRIIDEFINGHTSGKSLFAGEPLGSNFPVFDRWLKNEKILISTKSLDIAAQSYQNPSKLKNMLNKYADSAKEFEAKYMKDGVITWDKKTLQDTDFNKKVLEIILPDTIITDNSLKVLNEFKIEMEKNGMEVWYRIAQ